MNPADRHSRPLQALHVFSTFVPAGPQVRAVGLMRDLGPEFRHRVLPVDGNAGAAQLLPAELGVELVPAPQRAGPLGGLRAFRRLLAREQPDLLLTYNWGSFDAVLAARSLDLRAHVHHEDGFNADEARQQLRRRVWARRWGLARVPRIIVPSRKLEEIARRDWRVPPARLSRVVNGVDSDRFSPGSADRAGGAEIRARLGIPENAQVVGSVGHLRPVKRYDRLLRACALLPTELAARGVHVVVVGDGPQRNALEDLARDHAPPGGALHLPGHQTELVDWYRAMDVFVLSSDSEQLPLSLLEAMASGVPACATDVGDVRQTLPEEADDLLVDAAATDSAARLSAAIQTLLGDPERRDDLARRGRERVLEHYTHEEMVRTYRDLYLDAAGRADPAWRSAT